MTITETAVCIVHDRNYKLSVYKSFYLDCNQIRECSGSMPCNINRGIGSDEGTSAMSQERVFKE